jgi:NAD(P)H-dependent flavin oxidoreductase YrpB (nitropropane dioxygenase family)
MTSVFVGATLVVARRAEAGGHKARPYDPNRSIPFG